MADVGAEVGGIIENIRFEEGAKAEKGDIVIEIKKDRYRTELCKAEEKVKGLEHSVYFAGVDARNKNKVFALDGTTRAEVMRAESQLDSLLANLAEAKLQVEQAQRDLDACDVSAPFSGYLAIRYKQPNEPVHSLGKIFSLVDSSRVFAVAYVPEELLAYFPVGKECSFETKSGLTYSGVVDHIGKLIDPKTKSKKLHVLIQNHEEKLEVGMTGSISVSKIPGELIWFPIHEY